MNQEVKCNILLNEGLLRVKVSKIIFYRNHTGFSLLAPYHSEKNGYLFKMRRNLNKDSNEEFKISWDDTIPFSAKDRVKLSIHPDGFVQFSGENPGKIISGRDKVSGEIKGLGILTSPLSYPINGPTFALQVWGLKDYKKDSSKTPVNAEFYEHDYEYRLATKENWNSYIIEGFVFPLFFLNFSYINIRGERVLSYTNPSYRHEKNKTFVYRILPYFDSQSNYFVALLVSRTVIDSKKFGESGFILNSPSVIKNDIATFMTASYPPLNISPLNLTSLDYNE